MQLSPPSSKIEYHKVAGSKCRNGYVTQKLLHLLMAGRGRCVVYKSFGYFREVPLHPLLQNKFNAPQRTFCCCSINLTKLHTHIDIFLGTLHNYRHLPFPPSLPLSMPLPFAAWLLLQLYDCSTVRPNGLKLQLQLQLQPSRPIKVCTTLHYTHTHTHTTFIGYLQCLITVVNVRRSVAMCN